jgi:hypothetical protein
MSPPFANALKQTMYFYRRITSIFAVYKLSLSLSLSLSIYIYIYNLNESFDEVVLAGMGSIGNHIAKRFRTGSFPEFTE